MTKVTIIFCFEVYFKIYYSLYTKELIHAFKNETNIIFVVTYYTSCFYNKKYLKAIIKLVVAV